MRLKLNKTEGVTFKRKKGQWKRKKRVKHSDGGTKRTISSNVRSV